MTQEEKQILLRDLCARLPYGTVVLTGYDQEARYWNEQKFLETLLTSLVYEAFSKNLITFCKPYLRPMSSMTEKEKRKYDILVEEIVYRPGVLTCSSLINFCYEHHLDDLGLIEKGLALEAPEGMYKTE